jgi:hypothetical protein
MAEVDPFRESNWSAAPIRDLGLKIEGTRLEPVLAEFEVEREKLGLRVKPRYYLSTDWGVVTDTVAIAIPFYLARPELSELHAQRMGMIEGEGRRALLGYLRHEFGHVVNYAYKLYDEGEWVRLFGPITKPYLEEYHPAPFSRRFVRHLPGWYAQKHPDEDWAETFAVWMTPGLDWRDEYEELSTALAKLEWCDRTLATLREREPLVTATETEEPVESITLSVDELYKRTAPPAEAPRGLDGALRAIFDDLAADDASDRATWRPASELMREVERPLVACVFRWTGHFPERTRALLRRLASRCEALGLSYPRTRRASAEMAVTTFVTTLAMNFVASGDYEP